MFAKNFNTITTIKDHAVEMTAKGVTDVSNAKVNMNTAANNPLCARLQVKFDGRGAAAAGKAADAHTVSIPRQQSAAAGAARRISDPFEKTATYTYATAPAKAKTADTVKINKANAARRVAKSTSDTISQAKRRCEANEISTPFASGAYAAAYQRAAAIRARAYDGSEAAASARRQAERKAAARRPKPFSAAWFKYVKESFKNPVADEVKVETPSVSKGIIIAIVLCAVVVMMIIFSFAQISEFKREISQLEAKKGELNEQIQQLALDIDLKNDIRAIEQTATEEIGMVKSNQVQSKYITVGDGERVVVIGDDEKNEDYGVFSTLMSAVSSNWDKLLDYID